MNADLKEGPGNIIVILGLCFVLIDWLSFEEEGGRGDSFSKVKVMEEFWTMMDKGCEWS